MKERKEEKDDEKQTNIEHKNGKKLSTDFILLAAKIRLLLPAFFSGLEHHRVLTSYFNQIFRKIFRNIRKIVDQMRVIQIFKEFQKRFMRPGGN